MKTYLRIRDGMAVTEAEALDRWGVLRDGYSLSVPLFMRDEATRALVADAAALRARITSPSQATYERRVSEAWRNPPSHGAETIREDQRAPDGRPAAQPAQPGGVSASQQAYEARLANAWRTA